MNTVQNTLMHLSVSLAELARHLNITDGDKINWISGSVFLVTPDGVSLLCAARRASCAPRGSIANVTHARL